jgi:RNA polymerase sigma-70 factor (ECF subfamily)
MAQPDEPRIYGDDASFQTTHWSMLDRATPEEMGDIVGGYWKPVYCYLRRKGHDPDTARDLTQGFFCDVVAARGLFHKADPSRGKFRGLIVTALERYVISERRRQGAARRRALNDAVSLQGFDGRLPEPADAARDPESAFMSSWAATLLESVLERLHARCRAKDEPAYWRVFEARVLKPILEGAEPETLSALCDELGVGPEHKLSNMLVTMKRRFQSELRTEVRRYLDREEEVDAEIDELMRCLAGR